MLLWVLLVGVVLLAWLWCLFFGFVGCLGDAFGGLVDFGCCIGCCGWLLVMCLCIAFGVCLC